MKKLLLTTALAIAGTAGLSATNYLLGDPIEAGDFANMRGEYKVIMRAITKNVPGYVHTQQVSDTDERVYFGFKSAEMDANGEFTEDFVYTINVDENGEFSIKNSLDAYAPLPSTNSTSQYYYSTCMNVSEAGRFKHLDCITTAGYTDMYMIQAVTLASGTTGHREVHMGDNGGWSYYSTGEAGMHDAGGMAGNGTNTRTAGAFKLYKAVDATFPMAGEWYRIKNKETRGGSTGGNYLGYYPVNPWYIVSDSKNCNDKITMPIIASGKIAHLENGDSEADIDGQLWKFIAGEGENAGKHCLVNKAYPDGAISKMVANNQGQPQANANNTSRFAYTFNRAEKPDSVAWFTIGFPEEGYVSFSPGDSETHPYLCVAGDGQNFQVHRYGTNNNETYKWIPERYIEETYDPQAVFDAGIADLKAMAEGYAAMNIEVESELPVVTMPEGTTGATMDEAITAANNEYIAYINQFNNKWVTIYNNRRAATNGQTPWLSIYKNNAGTVATNTLAEPNDDSVWLMQVDNSTHKLRFYNRTTGYALRSELLTPADMGTGVRLHIEGTNNYVNIDTSNSDVTAYSTANDPGSIWTIAPAEYTFSEPQVSTKESPRYYRILSDRLMVKGNNPNLKVDGEDRAASGAGESVTYSNLNSNGIYWRIEDAGNGDGSVKIFNLVDGYAMKGGQLATGEAEDAAVFYLNKLSDTPYTSGQSNFRIVNSYALGSSSAVSSNSLNLNGGNTASVAGWAPTGDGRDCLTLDNNGGNGAIFYFIEASESEIEHATAAYITAVQNRIGVHPIQDEGDNLNALARENVMQEYARLVAEHNEALAAINTIDGVNDARRNGVIDNTAAVKAEVEAIVDKYIVGQHVNLYTKRADNTFQHNLKYMRDNGDAADLNAVNTNEELSTVWVITKNAAGNYIITNAATGRALGDINATNKTVAPESAFGYELIYNPRFAGFAIHKPGNADNTQSSVHLNSSSNVVKWSYAGTENSHWCIGVLPDVEYEVTYDIETGATLTLNGTLHDDVADDAVIVRVSQMPTEDDVVEQQSRAAVNNGYWEFTAQELKDNNYALPLSDLVPETMYKVEVEGAKMTTADGAHTRALNGSFKVNADGSVTGIEDVGVEQPAAKVYYDLQGRRVANPSRGLYISNGKKIIL